MKKKTLVASILGSVFLLGIGVTLVKVNFNSNASAKKDVATKGEVSLLLDEVEEGEVPEYFNILCTIKSKSATYSEVADKDMVLAFDVNSQYSGYNKMNMVVDEYEADGETPKTVHFESEVVGRERAWVTYTIFQIDKGQVYDKIFCDVYAASEEELEEAVFEKGVYEAEFKDNEAPNTYDTIVNLQSSKLSPDDCEDEIYTEVTYSINGGEEKTVYAHKEINILPGTATYKDFTYDVLVFANKGDTITYKVKVPTKDKDAVYEDENTIVVE